MTNPTDQASLQAQEDPMPTSPVLWHARLSTFAGIALGATHIYVELTTGNERLAVTRVLDANEADAVTKYDGFIYREGMHYRGFDSKTDAKAAAVAAFQPLFEAGHMLVCGDDVSLDPQEPLAGPEEFRGAAQALYDAADELGWWDKDPDAMGDVSDDWMTLIAPYRVNRHPRRDDTVPVYVRRTPTGWERTDA